jgi:hypothetical protein
MIVVYTVRAQIALGQQDYQTLNKKLILSLGYGF